MTLIEGWLPPTRANYGHILTFWRFGYPALGSLQWLIKWYGMGKTSTPSVLNLPGRVAWMTMEVPGFLSLLYMMKTLPAQHGIHDLPWQNQVLAGLFVLHYAYRAVLFPLLQPSMAPIHVFVWATAVGFQLLNGTCLGSWLAAYGPTTAEAWEAQSPLPQFALGLLIFYAGLAGNYFHDEELREIRRRKSHRDAAGKSAASRAADGSKPGGAQQQQGHYEIPRAGLFRYMLYPHYFCEWIEWAGFLMAAGFTCAPAWAFLVNEVCSMLPRAVRGKAWYVERFGADKVGAKWAVIPGVW